MPQGPRLRFVTALRLLRKKNPDSLEGVCGVGFWSNKEIVRRSVNELYYVFMKAFYCLLVALTFMMMFVMEVNVPPLVIALTVLPSFVCARMCF